MNTTKRIGIFDTIRGFSVILMIGFHACYDLSYLYNLHLGWFENPIVQNLWRFSVSWTFLFVAGWMATFSRNNLKRAAFYGILSCAIWVVTSLVAVDTPISFGILFCMAASTLILVGAQPILKKLPSNLVVFGALICFVLTYSIPHNRYDFPYGAWLGFPDATFTSGDYYPILPYFFMYLAGWASSLWYTQKTGGQYPSWARNFNIAPINTIGRHSLMLYLVHQPLVILVLTVFLRPS